MILVIALLVMGPKRLPELARSLGRGLAEFRKATSDITEELDNARIMVNEEVRSAARSAEGTDDEARPDQATASEVSSQESSSKDRQDHGDQGDDKDDDSDG